MEHETGTMLRNSHSSSDDIIVPTHTSASEWLVLMCRGGGRFCRFTTDDAVAVEEEVLLRPEVCTDPALLPGECSPDVTSFTSTDRAMRCLFAADLYHQHVKNCNN